MDNFKSQIIHVVNTVEKLNLPDRLEALNYLQKITDTYKNKSISTDVNYHTVNNPEQFSNKAQSRNVKHKCKNHLCLISNIKHLKKIVCFKCEMRCESEFQLFDHSRIHLDYPLSCIHCRCLFRNVEDFNSHKLTECKHSTNFQKYTCTACRCSFVNKKTFQTHLLMNHGVKLYNNWYGCKLCHEMYEQKKMLYHHYRHDHTDLNCPWKIKKKEELETASYDQKKENGNGNENLNKNLTEEAEKFHCFHCGRSFVKKSILSVHMKRHLGGKKEYVCMLCKKTFSVYRYYKRHLQTTSHQSKDGQDNYPLYKCELCYKVFPSHDALSRHNLRAHFGDKSLKCPLCDFRTSLAASLSRHVNLHTDNRKYICDQCGSCFHTLSALKDHTIYVHSNERNYSCEICGQRFKLKSGLNRHFKTHSDEKEFKCFCGQVYKFRTNLKRHLMNAHKVSSKKNSILRITVEEEAYAMNSPKLVQRKTAKQRKKNDPVEDKIEDFDISTLTELDIDLSCADEVLRETYDNFSKYSVESGESQESFNSILAPVNNIIDHVLQEEDINTRMKQEQSLMENKQYEMIINAEHQYSMNYRNTTCRQYVTSFDDLSTNGCSSIGNKIENQYMNSSFDPSNGMCESFNRHNPVQSSNLQDIQVEDDTVNFYRCLEQII